MLSERLYHFATSKCYDLHFSWLPIFFSLGHDNRCVVVFCMQGCVLSRFSHVRLCATLWTAACQLLCPWDSPGKNTGVGFHAIFQRMSPIQVLNPGLLQSRWIICHLSHQGSPILFLPSSIACSTLKFPQPQFSLGSLPYLCGLIRFMAERYV